MDDEKMTLRERWNRGLNDLSIVVEKVYGPRCQRFEPTCVCCMGWAVFDQLEKFTDSDNIDLADKPKQ